MTKKVPDGVLPSNIVDIFSGGKIDSTIKVRERNDIEVVYTYCIRYNLGTEEDTLIIDTNTFSYEEAVYTATQLIGVDYGDNNLISLKDCKVLDIELMEVHIHYE